MEESIDNVAGTGTEIVISDVARRAIVSGAKWGKFLAIIGFVFTGIMVIAALGVIVMGAMMGGFGGPQLGVFGVMYIVLAGVYFFPCLFLLKYANNVTNGLEKGAVKDIDSGFKNLELMFKFVGIMTIVIIGIYIIMFLFLGIIGAAGGF